MFKPIIAITLLFAFALAETTAERLARECENKKGESCYELGKSYSRGKNGLEENWQKAETLYKQACDYKYGEACDLLGFLSERSDINVSLAYYDKGCEYGYEISCFRAADINIKGVGREESGGRTDINASKALEYRIKACDLNANNCGAVAEIYETGREGVPKDMGKAMEYYKRKCDSKYENLETCQTVGQAYAIGDGVPKDFKIASEYYAKACKHDKYGGVCTRADILRAIADVGSDQLTIEVLTKSCDVKKNWFSCSALAGMYWDGEAFYDDFIPSETAPKDLNKAHEYFTKACAINKGKAISLSCDYAQKTLEQIKAQETNASIK